MWLAALIYTHRITGVLPYCTFIVNAGKLYSVAPWSQRLYVHSGRAGETSSLLAQQMRCELLAGGVYPAAKDGSQDAKLTDLLFAVSCVRPSVRVLLPDGSKFCTWELPAEPSAVGYDSRRGLLYAADFNRQMYVYSARGQLVRQWSLNPQVAGSNDCYVERLAVDSKGDVYALVTRVYSPYLQLCVYSSHGGHKSTWRGQYLHIAIDCQDHIYLTRPCGRDRAYDSIVSLFTPSGTCVGELRGTLVPTHPCGLATSNGLLYVANQADGQIYVAS